MKLNRRDLLKLGLLSSVSTLAACAKNAIVLPTTLGAPAAMPMARRVSFHGPNFPPFQTVLPIPPVLAPTSSTATEDYYEITMQAADLQLLPAGSPKTPLWTYNGIVPGPTIIANKGKAVRVKQTNNLVNAVHRNGTQVDTSIHLHGGHIAPIDDGHPNDLIQPLNQSQPVLPIKYQLYPNSEKEYFYPNNQDHSTLWYHDHADEHTGENVYMGLAGFYILHDAHELSLNLPSGDYDIPLVIQDKTFNADGSLYFPDTPLDMNTLQSGFLGDTILVNGAIQPFFEVGRRKYRFRMLNGSNGRQYNLALSSGNLTQIGTDGGLLQAPLVQSSILMGQAERIDLVIDFSDYPIGTQVELRNTLSGPGSSTYQILRFDVTHDESDPSVVPATLRTILPLSGSIKNRNWQLALIGNNWTINNKTYDLNRIDATPALNSVETWQFMNFSSVPHPMHPHGGMFQVLGRPDLGWKDTFNVQNGAFFKIIMHFTDFTGDYIFHCHNLEHEDHMMMTQFNVS